MYPDFKSYLQDRYSDFFGAEIEKFLAPSGSGNMLVSQGLLSLCGKKAENISVKMLKCHDDIGTIISMELVVSADIVTSGIGKKEYEAGRRNEWYTLFLQAELDNGLKNLKCLSVKQYIPGDSIKDYCLDEYMLPYMSTEQLDEIADDFIAFYCPPKDYDNWSFPALEILENMEVQCYMVSLQDGEFGRMYFRAVEETVETKTGDTVKLSIVPGTMLISRDSQNLNGPGGTLSTIVHEMVHWEHHRNFFEILSLLNDGENKISCHISLCTNPSELSGIERALWWAEWQANVLAPRMQMPRAVFSYKFNKYYNEALLGPIMNYGEAAEAALCRIASELYVSKYAAKTRAIQLGFDFAEGAFVYANGKKQGPYSFAQGSLEKNQTFFIDEDSLNSICADSSAFAGLLESELFVYVECVVCINESDYVSYNSSGEPSLTVYAENHLDECCIRFMRSFQNKDGCDFEYYGQHYLSQQIRASAYCETNIVDSDIQNAAERAIELQKINKEASRIMDIYRNLPMTFSGTLDTHMRRKKAYNSKTGKNGKITNMELAIRTGYSEDYIAQLRKEDTNISLSAVCAICIGLHLHPLLSKDLIAKSKNGFPDNKDGFIQQYVIEHHFKDSLETCNQILQESGCKPWGKL